ncbi:TetR/AcrR family transcriptional regulator, partial [Methylophaga sp. OBS4]|uniref:TetR/AcrR family transcriptional regulator n=1 Tax=Methylophaga sp. OBS4 TaxID=2991935 RepID=UPI00224ECADA
MDKRQQLVEAAFSLFYRFGIHAVGINQILQQAEVAKKTLYSHFASKEALVTAVLDYRDQRFYNWLESRMNQYEPGEQALLAMFHALDDWFNNRVASLDDFNGCFFINTCAEYGDPESPIHQQCNNHKQRVRELIQTQLKAMNIATEKQQELVDALVLLKEGAIVLAQVQGDKLAAHKARQLALQLFNNS